MIKRGPFGDVQEKKLSPKGDLLVMVRNKTVTKCWLRSTNYKIMVTVCYMTVTKDIHFGHDFLPDRD